MPIVLLAMLLGLVFGLSVRPPSRAYALTAIVNALGIAQMAWAVADGKGNDPWWIIPLAIPFAAASFGLCRAAISRRARSHAA